MLLDSAVTANIGEEVCVTLSVRLTPVSDASVRSGVDGGRGAARSSVNTNVNASDSFMNWSTAVNSKRWVPSASVPPANWSRVD